MITDDHYRKLERMYHGAPCNRPFSPIVMEVGKGTARVSLAVREEHLHSGAAVHGSVVFKLLDDAAFFAVNSLFDDVLAVTAGFNVHFLRPATGGSLVATGTVVQAGRSLLVAESSVVDDRGRAVARGSGAFVKSAVKLGAEVGYR